MKSDSALGVFSMVLAWAAWLLIGVGTVMFSFFLRTEEGVVGLMPVVVLAILCIIAPLLRFKWLPGIRNPLLRAIVFIINLALVQQIVVLGCFFLGGYSVISSVIGIGLMLTSIPLTLFPGSDGSG